MEIFMTVWLCFNIVFGLWSAKNWIIYFYAVFTDRKFNQSELGKMLDRFILVSVLSQIMLYN